jgi:hypothetical protein
MALHGCQMNAAAMGDAFARHSGLNAWAAGERYLQREAPQMKAIVTMLDRLSASRY